MPDKYVQEVLDDPFGFQAVISGEKHKNPNRFFSHCLFMEYFQKVPVAVQKFVEPISLVYLSCALAKIFVQVLFLYLLSLFISGARNPIKKEFLLSAVIIAPLFQAYGYWSRMGINVRLCP